MNSNLAPYVFLGAPIAENAMLFHSIEPTIAMILSSRVENIFYPKCSRMRFETANAPSQTCRAYDDLVNDLVTIIPADVEQSKTHLVRGDVQFGDYTAVGQIQLLCRAIAFPKEL
jgi:hypothetical protein